MKIVITCPRYFSEIENLENILSNQEVSIKKHNPKNQGFNYQEMEYLLKDELTLFLKAFISLQTI